MLTALDSTEKYIGSRGSKFRTLIRSFLASGGLKDRYIDLLTDEYGMKIYGEAFTDETIDPDRNYEKYEYVGDSFAAGFIAPYFYRRFPQLQCAKGVDPLSRLKQKYSSTKSFYPIAENLGFWDYISVSMARRDREKKALLEDVLEASIGATALMLDDRIRQGVGYALCYEILKAQFDQLDISIEYDELIDSKSRLKEIHDAYKSLPSLKYVNTRSPEELLTNTVIYSTVTGRNTIIGKGSGAKKKISEQNAAYNAVKNLKRLGIYKDPPEFYRLYCS
jgi:ribonuclease-3